VRPARTSARFCLAMSSPTPRHSALFAVLFASVCVLLPSRARAVSPGYVAESPLIRVGLMRFAGASALTLMAEPGARLLGPDGRERAAGMGPWTITVSGAGAEAVDAQGRSLGLAGASWRLQSEDAETVLSIAPPGGRPRRYRGSLDIRLVGGRLQAVNEVSLETYLRGVVASEIGASAPLEALKAQAVAARTFALRSQGKWMTQGYDLRDSTDSQAYGGADAETPESDRAVRETSGLILTIADQPIWAMFCADCGGVTAPGATPEDCPRSVVDADAHLHNTPHHVWTLRFTPERLASLLRRDPALRCAGQLTEVSALATDVSGRVRRLRLVWQPPLPSIKNPSPATGDKTPETVPTEAPVPDFLGEYGPIPLEPPADMLPDSGTESPAPSAQRPAPIVREIGGNTLRTLLGVDTLRSTLFKVRREPDGAFLFEGKGWGHGRGLCQQGAIAMAAGPSASDFRAILRRYYAGAALTYVRYRSAEEEESALHPVPPPKNRGREDLPPAPLPKGKGSQSDSLSPASNSPQSVMGRQHRRTDGSLPLFLGVAKAVPNRSGTGGSCSGSGRGTSLSGKEARGGR